MGTKFFRQLNSEGQQVAEILFKRLTDRSSDPRGVRRPTAFNEIQKLIPGDVSKDVLIEVIDAFRQPGRSLLMPPDGEQINEFTKVDISHESLMRVWVRLKRLG